MDFDAPASTWMPSPSRRPAVTLTFDIQNLIRSSVGLLKVSFIEIAQAIRETSWWQDLPGRTNERTNERGGRTAQKHKAFADIVG